MSGSLHALALPTCHLGPSWRPRWRPCRRRRRGQRGRPPPPWWARASGPWWEGWRERSGRAETIQTWRVHNGMTDFLLHLECIGRWILYLGRKNDEESWLKLTRGGGIRALLHTPKPLGNFTHLPRHLANNCRMYRGLGKGMHILLSNSQAGPGRNFSQQHTSLLRDFRRFSWH